MTQTGSFPLEPLNHDEHTIIGGYYFVGTTPKNLRCFPVVNCVSMNFAILRCPLVK